MKLNKLIKYGVLLSIPAVGLISCVSSGDNPGIEYSPQMYVSDGYEPYSQVGVNDINPYGMTMRLPVSGTIARGQLRYAYPYPNTGAGYEASAAFTSWLPRTASNVNEGERLYQINCSHCHGAKGDNKGAIFANGKMPPPPWSGYTDPIIQELPEGKIYHTLTHGKNFMGSHAHMLTPDERWMVTYYVKSLALGDKFELEAEVSSSSSDGDTDDSDGAMGVQTSSTGAIVHSEVATSIMSAMSKVMFKGLPARKEFEKGSDKYLNDVAGLLKQEPTYTAIIVGHTGETVIAENAESLGLERANAVINYLVSQGVDASRLKARSDGSTEKEGTSMTSEGRKANRRVEIEIYN